MASEASSVTYTAVTPRRWWISARAFPHLPPHLPRPGRSWGSSIRRISGLRGQGPSPRPPCSGRCPPPAPTAYPTAPRSPGEHAVSSTLRAISSLPQPASFQPKGQVLIYRHLGVQHVIPKDHRHPALPGFQVVDPLSAMRISPGRSPPDRRSSAEGWISPLPAGPTRTTNSPSSISRLKSFTPTPPLGVQPLPHFSALNQPFAFVPPSCSFLCVSSYIIQKFPRKMLLGDLTNCSPFF